MGRKPQVQDAGQEEQGSTVDGWDMPGPQKPMEGVQICHSAPQTPQESLSGQEQFFPLKSPKL